MDTKLNKDVLFYHRNNRPGKIEIKSIQACDTLYNLLLPHNPVVAESCLKIKENPDNVYEYTIKGNLAAVITNGTAVAELGNIGTVASKPVMEGKLILLKRYADIDGFDIELNTTDVDVFVRTVITMSPTFGAISLEYIKAPECFEIEKRLVDALNIPVMNDEQNGTSIVSAAGLINACEIAEKNIQDIKLVINGSGAVAMACAEMYLSIGVKKENLIMIDNKGVISKKRIDLDEYKKAFAVNTHLETLENAIQGADACVELSKTYTITPKMVQSMAESPIIFALENPNLDIYNDTIKATQDIIYASSRSDIPNHINNALVIPYIFRAALDVRAAKVNNEMKKSAVYALASLAKKSFIDNQLATKKNNLTFGRDYFLPKVYDNRLLYTISSAVAIAAIETGVAQTKIEDWNGNYYKLID